MEEMLTMPIKSRAFNRKQHFAAKRKDKKKEFLYYYRRYVRLYAHFSREERMKNNFRRYLAKVRSYGIEDELPEITTQLQEQQESLINIKKDCFTEYAPYEPTRNIMIDVFDSVSKKFTDRLEFSEEDCFELECIRLQLLMGELNYTKLVTMAAERIMTENDALGYNKNYDLKYMLSELMADVNTMNYLTLSGVVRDAFNGIVGFDDISQLLLEVCMRI